MDVLVLRGGAAHVERKKDGKGLQPLIRSYHVVRRDGRGAVVVVALPAWAEGDCWLCCISEDGQCTTDASVGQRTHPSHMANSGWFGMDAWHRKAADQHTWVCWGRGACCSGLASAS